jgi:hypothetical protein
MSVLDPKLLGSCVHSVRHLRRISTRLRYSCMAELRISASSFGLAMLASLGFACGGSVDNGGQGPMGGQGATAGVGGGQAGQGGIV